MSWKKWLAVAAFASLAACGVDLDDPNAEESSACTHLLVSDDDRAARLPGRSCAVGCHWDELTGPAALRRAPGATDQRKTPDGQCMSCHNQGAEGF
jgi:hypothetical protein